MYSGIQVVTKFAGIATVLVLSYTLRHPFKIDMHEDWGNDKF